MPSNVIKACYKILMHFENSKHYTFVYFYLNIGKHSDMHTLGVKIHDSLCETMWIIDRTFNQIWNIFIGR